MSIIRASTAERAQSKAAGGLKRLGIARGDRVGFCVGSSPELLFAIAGALRVGIVPVIINPQLMDAEREVIITDADVATLISTEIELSALFESGGEELAEYPLARPMVYTSGTTGKPKGVWTGILSESDAKSLWLEEIDQWSMDEHDVHLVCSPLHHSAPLRLSISTLLVGGSLVIPGPFKVDRIAAAIDEVRPTTTFCTPAHLQRLAESGLLGEFSKLRLVLHAGSPCDEKLKRRAISEIGEDKLWEFYGSTEGQFTICSSGEWLERPGTVGMARNGRTLSVNEDHIIWCRCPNYAQWEYWRDPNRTRDAWKEGSFTVGDIGHLDDDGYLFLSGRRNDLIISGGVNVYPAEVEMVFRQCEGVSDIVVFGREDERWGHRVCVAVVGDVTEESLRAFAVERLAPFKRPKEYHSVHSIPRSVLDKVIRSRMGIDLGLDSRGQ